MVGHPDCTYLANSGVCHLHTEEGRWEKLDRAAEFFLKLWNTSIPKVALENPTMHGYAKQRIGGMKETQVIQPWMFGHTYSKRTCLWMRGLPLLTPTNNVYDAMMKLPVKDRQPIWWGGSKSKVDRSRTPEGIAEAIASQWG